MLRTHETQNLSVNEWTVAELANVYDRAHHSANVGHEPFRRERSRGYGDRHLTEWYGGIRTNADAASILIDGWSQGAERLESLAREITPPTVKTRKRKATWSDDGSELGIDRAMRGQWDTAWRDTRRVWSAGPASVDLIAMIGGSAAHTPDELFWNGATAAVLSNVLESAGYPTSITGCFLHSADHNGQGMLGRTDVLVKGSDEPLRIDALASTVCHAGIFRTYMFQAFMQLPFTLTHGLGPAVYHWDASHIERMRNAGELTDGAIVLATCYRRDAAEREIARVLALVGGEA